MVTWLGLVVSYYRYRRPEMITSRDAQLGRKPAPMFAKLSDTQPMSDQTSSTISDVTVIGGGLAGKAASLHLAKAGLNVVCIEPAETVRPAVGESLDWSAPDLLSALGLPMEHLIQGTDGHLETACDFEITRRLLRALCSDGMAWWATLPHRVADFPCGPTAHRSGTPEHGRQCAESAGRDRVVRVERNGKVILAVHTAGGARFSSSWFIDASGFASCLLPREFSLPAIQFGPAKVAMWTYFAVTDLVEGTTLYMEPLASEYLEWIWEIPISPEVVSVGYVTTGAATKKKREQGLSVEDIFRQQLMKFPRFEAMLQAGAQSELNVTSFRCRVHKEDRRAELADRGRSRLHGGSHNRERGDGRLAARGGSVAAHCEVPETGPAAAAGQGPVQQPHRPDGEVFQQWNRKDRI